MMHLFAVQDREFEIVAYLLENLPEAGFGDCMGIGVVAANTADATLLRLTFGDALMPISVCGAGVTAI